MTVLVKKLKRDLYTAKGMLFAIIAIITVGIACMVGMLSTCNNLNMAKIDYYSRCRMADFWFELKKAPVVEVDERLNLDGVSSFRTRITFPVIVDLDGENMPLGGLLLSMPESNRNVINGLILTSGSYFTAERRNEVIVSDKFARARNITPGTLIHLIMNGQRQKLFVVGTGISSEFIYLTPPGSMAPSPRTYGAFWVKRQFAEDVYGFHGACNSIVGTFTKQTREEPSLAMEQMNNRLQSFGVFTQTTLKDQFSNLSLVSEMGGLQTMATMMPAVFLGVAVLVLNVVMLRMAEQQRTTIGTLKAIGVTNSSILTHFIQFGLFVGIVGGVAGGLLGYWIAASMTSMYKAIFTFPHLINALSPSYMILGFSISIVFAVLGTLKGVKRIIQLNPAEAMRPPPPESVGAIILERFPFFWDRLGFQWQIILRGVFRNRGRTLVAIFAAAMGSGMVLMSLGMNDSMNYMMLFQFQKVLLSDYELALRDDVDNGALYEARRMPGVYYAEPKLSVPCTFYNGNHKKKAVIVGIERDAALTTPRNASGQALRVPPAGLLMTKRMADQLGLKLGDPVSLVPVKGLRNQRKTQLVDYISSTFGMPVYAEYNYLNGLIGEDGALNSLQLKATRSTTEQAKFIREVKRFPQLSSLTITAQQRQQIEDDFIKKMVGMVYVMIMFAAVIFFGSILNSCLIAIQERQREIATFRVLGYHSTEIGASFLRETLLLNTIGAILGLPLGYWFLYGLAVQYQNDNYSMPCVVATQSWFITVVLAMAFVFLAHLIIQYTINKLNWSDALKMKE